MGYVHRANVHLHYREKRRNLYKCLQTLTLHLDLSSRKYFFPHSREEKLNISPHKNCYILSQLWDIPNEGRNHLFIGS